MWTDFRQGCRPSFVQIFFAAFLVLTALCGRVTAQQNNAPASAALPAVPQVIEFNGQFNGAADSGSAAIASATVSITFTLYENEQGGTALWSETDNVQVDAQGHYTALLGATSPQGLPLNIFTSGQAHWLAVQPQLPGYDEQPRVLLVSAPYALKAGDAETVGGLPPSAFMLAAAGTAVAAGTTSASAGSTGVFAGQPAIPPLSGSGTTNFIPIWTSSTNLGNSKIFQTGSNVGIGTTAPANVLDVVGHVNATLAYRLGGSNVLAMPGSLTNGNIAVGAKALPVNTTGIGNTAVGYLALSTNNTGQQNTATGAGAMQFNTSGVDDTATGSSALESNTTGGGNTATGYAALFFNSGGGSNTATGDLALFRNTLGYYNTATGSGALLSNSTGSSNTASGDGALSSNTTGSNNVAVGNVALGNNTTGSNNIAIGVGAGEGVSMVNSNNIQIGSAGSTSDSGAIRIGTIGTQTSFFVAGVSGVATGLNNAVPVMIDSNGQLGTISSSRRLKEDIHEMGDASRELMRLRPVTFRYKQPFDDGSKPVQYGLIAEEVAEVYPDMVARSADGQIETVKYQMLDPMLLNEVQRQQAQIQDLKVLVLEQQSQLKTQQAQIGELLSRVGTIQTSLRSRHKAGRATVASAKDHGEQALVTASPASGGK